MTKRLVFSLFSIVVWFSGAFAQEGLSSLKYNPVLQQFYRNNPNFGFGNTVRYPSVSHKHYTPDTLNLPFFDDFSFSKIFPHDSLWQDHQVFINADFPINPPSVGVATFDGLDTNGLAYEGINPNIFNIADSLTSQHIDLSGFDPSDSVVLSFFYQAQGRSFEPLESRDSLVVQFRNNIGAWVSVWNTPGIAFDSSFKVATATVNDPSFFHPGFQFRFLNYQSYIGALKQWHIDYVYLNQGRSFADTIFEDQAVSYSPPFPTEPYTHLPWHQFQNNLNKYLKGDYSIQVHNLAQTGETFSVEVYVDDPNGNVGANKLSGQSLPPDGPTSYVLNPGVSLFTNANDSFELTVTSKIGDILGGNDERSNDSAVRRVDYNNYYAYDDGTAESGYGIRNGRGSVAYGFELEQTDTLRAISIHFTQAEQIPAGSFFLKVWSSLAPIGQPSQDVDQELYSMVITGGPDYIDSINGFFHYFLDTPQVVSGKFYIGWTQNSSYMMNVGFDRNYQLNNTYSTNPELRFNVNNKWQLSTIPGTIMMRPHLGKYIPNPASVSQKHQDQAAIKVYPNPAHDKLHLDTDLFGLTYSLYSIKGQLVQQGSVKDQSISLEAIPNGIFFLRLQNEQGYFKTVKIIIQH